MFPLYKVAIRDPSLSRLIPELWTVAHMGVFKVVVPHGEIRERESLISERRLNP